MGCIFALDLGVNTGFAIGGPGDASPVSGSVALKKAGQERRVALGNMIAWLDAEWRKQRPALVVKEAPLVLGGFGKRKNSQETVLMTYGLHGVVEAMCERFSLRLEDVHNATVRKHFIGRGRMGDRNATKVAVIQRCRLLGYMPKGCVDDNRADALAVWDYAAHVFSRARSKKLFLFDERAA